MISQKNINCNHSTWRYRAMAVLVLFAIPAYAADIYVRDGGSCTSSCTSWTNASDQITTALSNSSRGDTIWVGDGSYNSITLDKANSSTTPITIKKATVAAHGTSTGWLDTYGDGQASIGSILLGSDYWVVDGATRNESNWASGSAYGFRISGGVSASTSITPGVCASNITVQYADIGGSDIGNTHTGSEPSSGFYIAGFDESCTNWTLSRNYVHNTMIAYHMNGTDTGVIEYSYIAHHWGKEAIRGQIKFKNWTIRFNKLKDSCQKDPGDATSGCTAEIALWDGSAGNWDNNKIIGNVIWKTTNENNCCGAIVVGGDNGGAWAGSPANNTLVLNNTIVGIDQGQGGVLINGGTGNEVRNTLGYDITAGFGFTPNTSSNAEQGTNPFVNYGSADFHLSAGIAGTSLSSPYNTDMDGITRGGDGTFDRGAFEFDSGAGPSAPTVTTTTATSITTTTASSGGNVTSDGGDTVTDRGVCRSTSANPTTSDTCTSDGTGTGAFTSSLSGMSPNTPYHIRAFATNSAGTSYGSDLTFTTEAEAPAASGRFSGMRVGGLRTQ